MTATIYQLSSSSGGVPKRAVGSGVISAAGLEGDRQRDLRYHGGPERALCLFSLERIEELRIEGHPIEPGSTGENVTVIGLDWNDVVPGTRLALGEEVEVEITSYTTPCKKISESFSDGRFQRISQKLHPGFSRVYARVVREGRVATGDAVRLL